MKKNLYPLPSYFPDWWPVGLLCILAFVACAPVGPDFQALEKIAAGDWQTSLDPIEALRHE